MDRHQVGVVLQAAKNVTSHNEFVVFGSLSVLGASAEAPSDMVFSIDVDFYPKADPNRVDEINREIGQGTAFEEEHGFYADAAGPGVVTLPEDWRTRLRKIQYPDNVIGLFLDPNDAAVAKLARHSTRDVRWVKAGLEAEILDAAVIEELMKTANFASNDEWYRARDTVRSLQKKLSPA
jgi:hypothetical protein